MPKMTIEITDEVHLQLLQEQFNRKYKKQPRTTLAEIAADKLEDCLVKKKPDQK